MLAVLWIILTYPFSIFRRRHDLALEVLALRHQLMVLKRQTRRPRLCLSDRFFLAAAHKGLAEVEKPSDHLSTRNTHQLAASWVQVVLAMEISTPTWAT